MGFPKAISGKRADANSLMKIIRHPSLAEDIREVSTHYASISERVHKGFWNELDTVLASVERNPRSHHFDGCGLPRQTSGSIRITSYIMLGRIRYCCSFCAMTADIPPSEQTQPDLILITKPP
jgi:hypothetical protein